MERKEKPDLFEFTRKCEAVSDVLQELRDFARTGAEAAVAEWDKDAPDGAGPITEGSGDFPDQFEEMLKALMAAWSSVGEAQRIAATIQGYRAFQEEGIVEVY